MITAIPMKAENISNHFSKADEVLFINDQAQVVGRFTNPALLDGCEGKQQLVSLILAQGANRVIIRNIGQQLLSKLLNQNLSVFHAKNGRTELQHFAAAVLSDCEQYTQVSQGRPSVKHIAKQANGGCCDHDHADGEVGCHSESEVIKKRCCETKAGAESAMMKPCCNKKHSLMHQH